MPVGGGISDVQAELNPRLEQKYFRLAELFTTPSPHGILNLFKLPFCVCVRACVCKIPLKSF